MGLWDYLKGWDLPEQSGDSRRNASGADSDAEDSQYNVPYRAPSPETPEWGGQGSETPGGGFGHSDDCKDVGQKGSTGGLSQADLERGYAKPERYDDGQFNQDVPQRNEWDRTQSYAKEHHETGAYDGTGSTKTGRGLMGSSTVKPGGQAD